MKVKLKKINEDAQLPKQANFGDFCYDVWAVSEEEIVPNVWRYGLGFKVEIERDMPYCAFSIFPSENFKDYNLSIDFRPRSSIWKTGMVLSNSVGTIDEFYRGEIKAVFYHVMPNMPRYRVGDKIGQIKIGMSPKVTFEFVDEINENTERGEGGFGSTGK